MTDATPRHRDAWSERELAGVRAGLEATLASAEAVMEQTAHVLDRLEAGLHGACEVCGRPIDRTRMAAFPRATICLPCLTP